MYECDFGFIGLGVMGQNLARNMASKGFRVAVHDHLPSVNASFSETYASQNLICCTSLSDLVGQLKQPRMIQVMVPAGDAVDAVIAGLVSLLDPGDLIIDGGNTLFVDTARRERELADKGIRFLRAGMSGGEEGALKGPSIMPSGDRTSWSMVKPFFEAIAAKVDGQPCVVHVGSGGAGHYVKMVHNGIEYADMQLICEAYHILKSAGFSNTELADIFDQWNQSELESYLIEITAQILRQKDLHSDQDLIDVVVDRAGQKGTGRWTALSGVQSAVPLSAIASAVEARLLSSRLDERRAAATVLAGPDSWNMAISDDRKVDLVRQVRSALYLSKIVAYAQGLDLVQRASDEHNWQVDISAIASVWRGGCIIRAVFLHHIVDAYKLEPTLINMMLAPFFVDALSSGQHQWREVVAFAARGGIPIPSISAALSYFDAYRCRRLPANLLQAQRDFFGAHSFERTDQPEGEFFHHPNWPTIL